MEKNKYFIAKTSISETTAKKYREELLQKFSDEQDLHEFIRCGAADIYFCCIQSELTAENLYKAEAADKLKGE